MLQFASTLACGLVVAVVSAYVTVRLALRRFYSEKWWEKKLAAYVTVIEALFHIGLYMNEQVASRMGETDLSEERTTQLHQKWREGRDEVARVAAMGTFLISTEASQALEALLEKLDEAERADNFWDWAGTQSKAVFDCLSCIRDLAKADLRVK